MSKDLNNCSEEEQLIAVQRDLWVIRYIKNPSEAVQLAAVQQYGGVIDFIKNPSEIVQIAAMQQDGRAIMLIKNPSEEVQLASLKYLFECDYDLPKNVTSPKAIDKWNKMQEMKKACE